MQSNFGFWYIICGTPSLLWSWLWTEVNSFVRRLMFLYAQGICSYSLFVNRLEHTYEPGFLSPNIHLCLNDKFPIKMVMRCKEQLASSIVSAQLPWKLYAWGLRLGARGGQNWWLQVKPLLSFFRAIYTALLTSRHFGASCLATTHKHSRNITRKIPSRSAIFLKCREVSSEVSQCKW